MKPEIKTETMQEVHESAMQSVRRIDRQGDVVGNIKAVIIPFAQSRDEWEHRAKQAEAELNIYKQPLFAPLTDVPMDRQIQMLNKKNADLNQAIEDMHRGFRDRNNQIKRLEAYVRAANVGTERVAKERDQLKASLQQSEAAVAEMRRACEHWNERYHSELDSIKRNAEFCKKEGDTHGMNFHQGAWNGLVWNDIALGQVKDFLKNNTCGQAILAELKASHDRVKALQEDVNCFTRGISTSLEYPRGSEAQVRCLEEVGQDAKSLKITPPAESNPAKAVTRRCRSCGTEWTRGDGYCPKCGKNECDWITPTEPESTK